MASSDTVRGDGAQQPVLAPTPPSAGLDRPILFSAPMVRALMAGTKTQTRRIVKPGAGQKWLSPEVLQSATKATMGHAGVQLDHPGGGPLTFVTCPYGVPGGALWVREAWRPVHSGDRTQGAEYRADKPDGWRDQSVWKPQRYMPRWASRITLKITDVRVERLNDISEADALAEGIERIRFPEVGEWGWPQRKYRELWNHINGPGSWDANPWVWCVAFEVVR